MTSQRETQLLDEARGKKARQDAQEAHLRALQEMAQEISRMQEIDRERRTL